MQRPDPSIFKSALHAGPPPVAFSSKKVWLSKKIAVLYQDLTDLSLKALAVLSAINEASDGTVGKRRLAEVAKFGTRTLPCLRLIGEGGDCLADEYLSVNQFKTLIKKFDAAEICTKIHCCPKDGASHVTGDQVTRLRVRWYDVTTMVMKCIFELRALGMELHGPSETPMRSSLENWLIDVRGGGSLLDDPMGPLSEMPALNRPPLEKPKAPLPRDTVPVRREILRREPNLGLSLAEAA